MGPTCNVLLEKLDDGETLDAIDALLELASEKIDRTRKGRVWNVWVRGRPIHVSVASAPPVVELSAGCNSHEDWAIVRELAAAIAQRIGGLATEPNK